MAWVFAMTIPGLVVGLVLLGVLDRLGVRAPERRSGRGAAATGFDVFHTLFSPAKEHEVERRRMELLWREDAEEGAPPRSRVDLDAGVARLVVPKS